MISQTRQRGGGGRDAPAAPCGRGRPRTQEGPRRRSRACLTHLGSVAFVLRPAAERRSEQGGLPRQHVQLGGHQVALEVVEATGDFGFALLAYWGEVFSLPGARSSGHRSSTETPAASSGRRSHARSGDAAFPGCAGILPACFFRLFACGRAAGAARRTRRASGALRARTPAHPGSVHPPLPGIRPATRAGCPHRPGHLNTTHKTAAVTERLARRKHWHVHVTPTSASWINQAERWRAGTDPQAVAAQRAQFAPPP